ncbi:MAG TPA: CrcB family protein [Petrimonas sp.]|jgi:fluoride ion exporter CrcB/FEX|nr:CrcB family protein [Petrimonas sp.]
MLKLLLIVGLGSFVGGSLRYLISYLMKGISTGGFTTFSAFANEGFLMLSSGNLWGFIGYVTSSVILGVTLVASGYLIVK